MSIKENPRHICQKFWGKTAQFDHNIVGSLLEGNSVLLTLISFEIFSEIFL